MDEQTASLFVFSAVFGIYAIVIWLLIVANSRKDDKIDKIDSRYRGLKKLFHKYHIAVTKCNQIEDPEARNKYMQELQMNYLKELTENY